MKRVIVVVAGWGQGAVACQPLCEALGQLGDVRLVLPLAPVEKTFAAIESQVQTADPLASNVLLLGWSLGGLLAIRWLAALPEQSREPLRLCLLGVNPRFTSGDGWPGVAETVFDSFADLLSRDPRAGLLRFMALQVKGDKEAGSELKRLRHRFLEDSKNRDSVSLAVTLSWLREWDLRGVLAAFSMPLLCLFGEHDALVPAEVAGLLSPRAAVGLIPDMGHYPGWRASPYIAERIDAWWRT